jgi:hypothetical protein
VIWKYVKVKKLQTLFSSGMPRHLPYLVHWLMLWSGLSYDPPWTSDQYHCNEYKFYKIHNWIESLYLIDHTKKLVSNKISLILMDLNNIPNDF